MRVTKAYFARASGRSGCITGDHEVLQAALKDSNTVVVCCGLDGFSTDVEPMSVFLAQPAWNAIITWAHCGKLYDPIRPREFGVQLQRLKEAGEPEDFKDFESFYNGDLHLEMVFDMVMCTRGRAKEAEACLIRSTFSNNRHLQREELLVKGQKDAIINVDDLSDMGVEAFLQIQKEVGRRDTLHSHSHSGPRIVDGQRRF